MTFVNEKLRQLVLALRRDLHHACIGGIPNDNVLTSMIRPRDFEVPAGDIAQADGVAKHLMEEFPDLIVEICPYTSGPANWLIRARLNNQMGGFREEEKKEKKEEKKEEKKDILKTDILHLINLKNTFIESYKFPNVAMHTPGGSLFSALHTMAILKSFNRRCCLGAGSVRFPMVTPEEDDGELTTLTHYENFGDNKYGFKDLNIPSCHFWVYLYPMGGLAHRVDPMYSEIVDLCPRYFGEYDANLRGISWPVLNMASAQQHIWQTKESLPNGLLEKGSMQLATTYTFDQKAADRAMEWVALHRVFQIYSPGESKKDFWLNDHSHDFWSPLYKNNEVQPTEFIDDWHKFL